jgi:SAM-dependent methyltransferase
VPASLPGVLAAWRASRQGHAPLYNEPAIEAALAHVLGGVDLRARILDLGCGAGQVAAALAGAGYSTIALDVDRQAMSNPGSRGQAQPVVGHAERLPFRDASIDGVFAFSVLQYMDRGRALAELRRVVRPGGRVALVENLAAHPLIRGYRWWREWRFPDIEHATGQLRWRERSMFAGAFSEVRVDACDLFSPALLLSPWFARLPGDVDPRSWARRVRMALERADRNLLESCPPLRGLAWRAIVRAVR